MKFYNYTCFLFIPYMLISFFCLCMQTTLLAFLGLIYLPLARLDVGSHGRQSESEETDGPRRLRRHRLQSAPCREKRRHRCQSAPCRREPVGEKHRCQSAPCRREPVRSKEQISTTNMQPVRSKEQISTTNMQPVRSKKQISTTNMHKDPPSEIFYSTHPEHKLKLMTAAGTLFLCDGCKEPGYGPRYTCDCGGGGRSLDLHTRCALAGDPLFGLHTLVHPLFGYGRQFEFRFLQEGRTRVCDACGDATRGFVYHCSEQDVDIHPCCGSLPDRIIHDGRAFDPHRRASRPCALCPENEGQRRWFWAYRCYMDSEEAAVVDLHVACLKETARRSWEVNYRKQDAADSALNLNVDGMLDNKFGEIAGTVASFITALVFGKQIVNM